MAYLHALLSGDFAGHELSYVPVGGEQRRARALERSQKRLSQRLRIDTSVVLDLFGQRQQPDQPATETPRHYADVLDAYRALPGQPIRRLAVLGEPGAGKSFSLERVAVEHARLALHDPAAQLPVLVRLGLWTRAGEPLQALIERQLGELGPDFAALRDAGRVVLMLDGLNEIPPGQRATKADDLCRMAEDERFAAVLVSCRERDFHDAFDLPFDRLTLQPLSPMQVHRFLHRYHRLDCGEAEGARRADDRFWAIAGGPEIRAVWDVWRTAGASLEQFWTVDTNQLQLPNVFSKTTHSQDELWRTAHHDPRSLMRLAANPYILTVMALLPELPHNRAALFDSFLRVLYQRERQARQDRHDGASVPDEDGWLAMLTGVAEALQRATPADEEGADGAGTTLPRARWPTALTPAMLAFAIDASVLRLAGDDLRFSHQLLQEALAAPVLLRLAQGGERAATEFWPAGRWWRRSGWEVVAELAAESSADDVQALEGLIAWLAEANPEVAALAWQRAGAPPLGDELTQCLARRWLPAMTDDTVEPAPRARAAVGRAMAVFDLDRRRGVGLDERGLPDIDWVPVSGSKPFVCQGQPHPPLPDFEIARYPITHRQYQAFIDAWGYRDDRWWTGLADHPEAPAEARWRDANAPRETVNWFEAVAFCRWLGDALGYEVMLPTEQQCGRVAGGGDGRAHPWGETYDPEKANSWEGHRVGRTSAVGILPHPSPEGVHDLSGNVWEWCLNAFHDPKELGLDGSAARVLRGGSWLYYGGNLRIACRYVGRLPNYRYAFIGFRVCRASPTSSNHRPQRR